MQGNLAIRCGVASLLGTCRFEVNRSLTIGGPEKMTIDRKNRRIRGTSGTGGSLRWCAATVCAIAFCGCSAYIDPRVPEPIRPFVEPRHAVPYLLYRPSSYDGERRWPLVITCHGSFPDSPNRRLRTFTPLAESYGFIVAAPKLSSTAPKWPVKADRQIALQRRDEQAIAAMITHICASHRISEDRIFIHGGSGGAFAALYTGIRNPQVFRAMAISHPKFDERFLADAAGSGDPHQPILVDYQPADLLTGKHGRRAVAWLQSRRLHLSVDSHDEREDLDAQRAVQFFENVVRLQPWLRIRAFPTSAARPLEIQFKLHCAFGNSHRPVRYRWDFGDGSQSTTAEPVHAYDSPGVYRLSVEIDGPDGGMHRRDAALTLPQGELRYQSSADPENR